MNERIEQLAEQCWVHTNKPLFGAKSPHWEFDRQKFAELIVRECMELALTEQKRYANVTHRNMAECAVTVSNFRLLMKEHFGVEE